MGEFGLEVNFFICLNVSSVRKATFCRCNKLFMPINIEGNILFLCLNGSFGTAKLFWCSIYIIILNELMSMKRY